MARRSLNASKQGINNARTKLTKMGIRQKDLQQAVGCSRQPLTNFFAGKPIVQDLFISICDHLDLDWQETAGLTASGESLASRLTQTSHAEIDHVVTTAREQIGDRLAEDCGTMRVLDMTKPVGIDRIYTSVNVLEKIPSSIHTSINYLVKDIDQIDARSFERLGLGEIIEERIPGLAAVEKYQKLIILGKPGSGKTTFLKHLAIECISGKFKSDLVPIFITLKNFAEAEDQPDLITYMSRGNVVNYIPAISTEPETEKYRLFYQIIQQGRALILLDGLDEINQEDSQRILDEISDFSTQFYQNHFVITCRLAVWEKNYKFDKFTEVEIAQFDEQQIEAFVHNWFSNNTHLAKDFLLCLSNNSRIQQLATTPLLLTLLCLVFGTSGYLPLNHSQLYKEGVDILLRKWDTGRGIERDQVYQQLSLSRKEHLLSRIALTTFEQKKYLFEQQTVINYISDYITNLNHASSDPIELEQASLAILRSIEAQHGLLIERAKNIYSFSHLSFQEYFAAREILNSSERHLKPRNAVCRTPVRLPHGNGKLKKLLTHLTQKRWREIILLVAEMLPDATIFLQAMKQRVDQTIASNQQLQTYLKDLNRQAEYIVDYLKLEDKYLPAIRAFLFDPDFDIDQNRRLAVGIDSVINLFVCASFFTRVLQQTDLAAGIKIAQSYDSNSHNIDKIYTASSANAAMSIAIKIAINSDKLKPQLKPELNRLIEQYNTEKITLNELADLARGVAKNNEHIWSYFTLLKNWQFTEAEKEQRRTYYAANALLVECLNRCWIESQAREKIKTNLLLPVALIDPNDKINNNEAKNSLT